jgi:hypothetical protein
MKDKTVTILINSKITNDFAKAYKTHTAGVRVAAENYMQIREATLFELKGVFTQEELKLMIEKVNVLMMPQISEKLKTLTSAQKFFLQDEINRYWNEPKAYGYPDPDINMFLEVME